MTRTERERAQARASLDAWAHERARRDRRRADAIAAAPACDRCLEKPARKTGARDMITGRHELCCVGCWPRTVS